MLSTGRRETARRGRDWPQDSFRSTSCLRYQAPDIAGIDAFAEVAVGAAQAKSAPILLTPHGIGGVSSADPTLLPLPITATIMLSQHIGAPAVPCVGVGEHVERGQELLQPWQLSGSI